MPNCNHKTNLHYTPAEPKPTTGPTILEFILLDICIVIVLVIAYTLTA